MIMIQLYMGGSCSSAASAWNCLWRSAES